jgi:diguanylate cyclase (GGDEF)-like protein
MRLMTAAGPGGHTVRRLLPVLVSVPIVCGGIVIIGVDADLFSLRVGVAFVVSSAIVIFSAISFATANQLETVEAERRRLAERLSELAERDPLTGVHNRRRLDDELHNQLALAQRRGSSVAVLAVDLDRFKPINDTFGHAVGDELLIATADALSAELRETDGIYRLGGDEFVVILPDTGEAGARLVAGKLSQALRQVRRPLGENGDVVELSASIGVAASEVFGWAAPTDLLVAADRALYAAKHAGGNRFAAAPEPVLD